MGRFINADGYAATGQGLLGNNMFAYCLNNPITYCDYSGESVEIAAEIRYLLPALALIDAFTPFLEVAGIVIGAVTVGALATKAISDKKDENSQTITGEKVITSDPSDVIIYRYNATKSKNLAPRNGKDYDGVSFSTNPPKPGQKAVATTINTVNATGLLHAVQHGTHVSVVPTGVPIQIWMSMGMNSIWSQTLSAIVIEVKG